MLGVADDEEANTRKDGEVRWGGGACGATPTLVPLPTTVVVIALPQQPVGWGRCSVRWCGSEWMGGKLLRWGNTSGWLVRSIL
jgi:hypothetical protein